MGDAAEGLVRTGEDRCAGERAYRPRGLSRAPSVKKPPVFIGLGAVLQQEICTLFLGTENPLAFLRIG